jgi:predicted enzyme related to lactoylglutathione lyase
MTVRTDPWPSGVPCWAELTSPDIDAAKAFYGSTVGWEFSEAGPEYGGYVMGQVSGRAAAGIAPQQEGAPVAWTLYLASDDVDATAQAITDNDGSVFVPPMEVGDFGRMCLATDPTGAAFGVWQHGSTIGAEVTNEPGGLTWEDLRTSDPDSARAFYSGVFGFRADPIEGAPGDYTTFALAGQEAPLGGIGGMMDQVDLPPHWAVYFGVASADAAVAACEPAGGRVLSPAFETPYGKMASMADPAGAIFWIVEMAAGGTQGSQA